MVDLEQIEGRRGGIGRDHAVAPNLDVVPHPLEQPVGDPGRPPAAVGDRTRALDVDLDLEQPGRAPDDQGELLGGVMVQAMLDPEAIPERRVSSPDRVVAPIRVKGGSSNVTTRAPAPWPTVIGRQRSSIAG